MKAYGYLIILGILLVGAGIIIFTSSGSAINNSGSGNGQIKDITLGIKNYNYYPNTITVKEGDTVRIRLDSTVKGCYRYLTIRGLGIAKSLPTSEDYIEFIPDKTGSFRFACGMGMGTGTLVVE